MDNGRKNFFSIIKQNWLFILIAAQPVLDVLAYWTNNTHSSWAGYIRLGIMIALPVCMLFSLRRRRHFVISMLVIGLFCVLHVLNCFRIGYIDPFRDISYMARVAQMPVLAICFVYAIKDERMKNQAVKAMETAAGLVLLALAAAIVTGTENVTYGVGLGVSGWVIDNNRCANSIILVTLSCFAMYFAVKSENRWLNVIVPAVICAVLISNGTKACYFSIFALFVGFAAFLVINRAVNKAKLNRLLVVVLLLLAVFSAVIYPYTPRAKVEAMQRSSIAFKDEDELVRILKEKGYDPANMTVDEKLADPVVREAFETYYYKLMWNVLPEMFERFDMERIMRKYDMTTSAAELINTRLMKCNYASMIWEDTDTLTKLVGYEVSEIKDPAHDPENDWPALFYYYGYLGFGLYMAFILLFVWKLVQRVVKDFRGSLNLLNFTLLICFALQMGLAEFSGALLRRPNVSIYLSVLLALIYYRTVRERAVTDGGCK